MVSPGRVLFSFLQSLGYSVVSLAGDFFSLTFCCFFLARGGSGGRRERRDCLHFGQAAVLVSLESGYLEKGNDDW